MALLSLGTHNLYCIMDTWGKTCPTATDTFSIIQLEPTGCNY